MITYTLFVWTVVAVAGDHHGVSKQAMDWRALTTVESYYMTDKNPEVMMAKCEDVARQLSIPKERYRCIRTK